MPEDQVFRERIVEPPEEVAETKVVPMEEGVSGSEFPVSPLEEFETKHSEYGKEFFDIKETAKEFPLKMHFGALNKYITELIQERNWEQNAKNYQKVLSELEGELGTGRLETFSRIKRLYDYIQVKKKYKSLKEKMDRFRDFSSGSL